MTWQLCNPTASDLEAFRQAQSHLPLSYHEVGATAGAMPPGYAHDLNSAVIGRGEAAYLRAVEGAEKLENVPCGMDASACRGGGAEKGWCDRRGLSVAGHLLAQRSAHCL